jgi:TolA-binding protein
MTELLKAILQADAEHVIIFILALVVLYALWRLSKTETRFDVWYEQKLAEKQQENDRLLKRVADLEEQAKQVPELQDQVRVLCDQLGDLQVWKIKAEPELEQNQREIKRLTSERDRALELNKWYVAKHEAFLAVFGALGMKPPGDTTAEPVTPKGEPPSAAPASTEPTSDSSPSDPAAVEQSTKQMPREG